MSRWALIDGGAVANVVEQDDEPSIGGQWVNIDGLHVGPGFTYNGTAFAAPATPMRLTPRAFWRRFTAAEREALQGILATGTQGQKNKLNAFRDYVLTGGMVELDDDYIVASVTLMETAGIIAAGRATAILTAPPTAAEAQP